MDEWLVLYLTIADSIWIHLAHFCSMMRKLLVLAQKELSSHCRKSITRLQSYRLHYVDDSLYIVKSDLEHSFLVGVLLFTYSSNSCGIYCIGNEVGMGESDN
jgi:hypothetical protein